MNLKKLVFLLLLLIPFSVNAQVDKSVFIMEDNVSFEDNVNGIGFIFGNNVSFEGEVEYGLIAGSNVEVSGSIVDDSLFAGQTITFEDDFVSNRDVYVFGSTVELKGDIKRDIIIYAEEVLVEGALVDGSLTINASNIDIKNSTINELKYNEDAKVDIEDNNKINNKVLLESKNEDVSFLETLLDSFISWANLLVVFLVLVLIFPQLFKKIEKQYENITTFNFISLMGYGALSLVLIVVVPLILFNFVIGTYLAVLLIALYIGVVLFSTIFTGFLIGNIIWNKFIKKEKNMLLVGLIGIMIINILGLIPSLGVFITLISTLIGIGIVMNLFKKVD